MDKSAFAALTESRSSGTWISPSEAPAGRGPAGRLPHLGDGRDRGHGSATEMPVDLLRHPVASPQLTFIHMCGCNPDLERGVGMLPSVTLAFVARVAVGAVLMTVAPLSGHVTRGPAVTGTYSTGGNAAWQPLPTVHLQRGRPAADATVVIDPSQVRQRYTGL